MGKEIELKLRIESTAQLKQLRRYPEFIALCMGEEMCFRMETTYFDTEKEEISERKWTLRRRKENGRSVICLKTPAQTDSPTAARGEWETAQEDMNQAIAELLQLGAPQELASLTANGLKQTCGACFERRARMLRLPDGSTCELAFDEGEVFGGNQRQQFTELELELKSGQPEQMLALAQRLQEAYGLQFETQSKFARANNLRLCCPHP